VLASTTGLMGVSLKSVRAATMRVQART